MPTTQFDSTLERRESDVFGMWAFLATEVLFFGPLFFGYLHARLAHPEAFSSASHHMHVFLGTLNTAVLLTSSLTMAAAVKTSRRSLLVVTALLGAIFLGIKGYEWVTELGEASRATDGEALFYFLYYAMTGLHGIHLTIGIGIVAWLAARARRFSQIEVTGLYWHFVDVIWVFLYPMFYLLERWR